MKLPGFVQRLADRFNAETGEGLARGWQAAHSPAAGRGPGSRRQVARRWLDAVGQRLDGLLAQDRARPAPAGGLRKLGRAATFPARVYTATTLAFGYATAETMGWHDGHRARAAAAAGPSPHPGFTGPGTAPGHAGGYTARGHGQQATYGHRAAYGARAAYEAGRAAGGSRMAAASGSSKAAGRGSGASSTRWPGSSAAALSGLSYASPASAAPGSPPATPTAISLPAAPNRRAIASGRSR